MSSKPSFTVEPCIKPLSLTNNGELELFFIGTGTAFAKTLNQTNFLIIKGQTHIMVDFGMTGPRALWETAGLETTDIGVLLPTHSHADHVGGIEALALMNRYVGQRSLNTPKLKIIITEEYARILWDQTLRGGLSYNEEMSIINRTLTFGDYFEVIRPAWKTHQPREIYEMDFGEIHLEIFRTNHMPEQSKNWQAAFVSYGLYIDNRVFISVDTQFDPELIALYDNKSEIMFHDVQFFDGGIHTPLKDLKTLPADIKPKMLFIHYADNWDEQNIDDFLGWTIQGR